ncbi:glutathione S-transferase 1-like isoform X1 [Danaus plexippus]|uniref:glutathione S-transferase 1-like isoform X1 n=2 Tax=Danaus plexippus TaxID=13037 RepID=UPI002AAF2837|nr:glutathione S-transferase 1-like isoform X1 [Danaus plexippus]
MSKVTKLPRLLLYKRNASPPSSAVMILGDMLGLNFDYREPDLIKLEHRSPEFKKINPMATIPVLQDGDVTICESHAIMKYLVNKYGGERCERLYPADLSVRANIDQLMFYDAGVLFVRLKVVALPTMLQGLTGPTKEQVADIDEGYTVLEAYLNKHSYIATDHLTIADLSVGTTTTALQSIHKLDKNRFPLSAEWLERLKGEKSFKKFNEPSVKELSTILNVFWKKNKERV